MPQIYILPNGRAITVPDNATEEDILRSSGFGGFVEEAAPAPAATPSGDGFKSDFWDDLQRGAGSAMAGLGSALRDVYEPAGRWLEETGTEIVRNNPADYASLSDIKGLGDLFGFGLERITEMAPQLGGAAAASVLGTPAAGLGVLAGTTGLTTYGESRAAQREAGVEDKTRAALTALPAAALDVFGVGRVVPGAGRFLGEVFEGGLRGAGKAAARVGAEEAGTEVLQTGLQRFGGYEDLTSPEAIEEYKFAALSGGLAGGALGGGRGFFGGAEPAGEPGAPPLPPAALREEMPLIPPEAPAGIAEAPALRTIELPSFTEAGGEETVALSVLSEPDEGGNVWVRTPEGRVTSMPEPFLRSMAGEAIPETALAPIVEEPTPEMGEAPGTFKTVTEINGVPVTVIGETPTLKAPEAAPLAEEAPIDVLPPEPVPAVEITPEALPSPTPETAVPLAAEGVPEAPTPEALPLPEAAPIDVTPEVPEVAPVEGPAAVAEAPEQYTFTPEKAQEVSSYDPTLAKALIGKTVSGGAEVLAQRTKSPFYRQMANRVAGVARAMEGAGIRMPIGITNVPGGQGMASEGTMRAARRPNTGGVTNILPPLEGGPYTAFEVGMKGKPTGTVPRGANEQTLLHEMLHSVTTGAQRMADKFPSDSRMGQALKDIKKLHGKVLDGVRDIKSGKLEVSEDVHASLSRLERTNAFLNERELLAWGMTDYDMQNVLKAIPTKQGNAFTEFVAAVAKMLGVGPKDYNALRELIELTEVAIPTDVAAQQEMIGVVTGKIGEEAAPVIEPEAKAVTDAEAASQTETPEFKAWFGDSKVVDADGKPLVVFHGTQGGDFNIFKPGSWFSDNPSESSAYTFAGDVFKRDKASGKYRIASGAKFAGKRVPLSGILADVQSPKVGGIYATDNGVYRYLGDRKWEIFYDLDDSYDGFRYEKNNDMSVILRRGDYRQKAEELVRDYEDAVERTYPGGVGGRVYPVYLSIKNPIKLRPLEANRIARRLGMGDAEIEAKIREYEAAGYDGIETTSDEATIYPEVFAELGGIPKQWIAFRPEQIKSATGNVGTFDPNRPEIDMEATGPSPAEDEAGRPVIQYSLGDETRGDRYRRIWVDKMRRLGFVEEAIQKSLGRPLSRAERPSEKAALFEGRADTRLKELEQDHINKIIEVLKKENIPPEKADLFLLARAAPARNAKIAKRNPDMPDGGSGMTNDVAQQIMLDTTLAGDMPKMLRLASAVDAMTKATRNRMVEYGLISKKQAEALEREEPYYVPLKGNSVDGDISTMGDETFNAPGTGRGFSVTRKEYLAAKGRMSMPFSPLATAMNDAQDVIVRGERNRVGQSFLNDIAKKYDSNAWQVFTDEKPDMTVQYVQKDNKVRAVPVNMAANAKQYFVVKENGKPYYIKINDPILMRALTNGSTEQFSAVNKFLGNTIGKVTRALSQLHTTLNPEFVVPNVLRDVEAAVFNLAAEQDAVDGRLAGQKIIKGVLKDIKSWDNLKRLYKATFNHEATTAEQKQISALFQQAKEDGAFTGWILYSTPEEQMAKIKDELDRVSATGKKKLWYSTRDGAKRVIERIQDLNSVAENVTRFSVYKNALEAFTASGMSEADARDQAANMARNVTVDFNRKGEAGPTANAIYAFFNASVQGNVQLLRSLYTARTPDGKRTRAQKMAMGLLGLGLLMTMVNRGMSEEDEDGMLFYDKIPDWEKERNMVLMLPDGKEYLKIPMPYGYSIFHNIGSMISDMVYGNKTPADAAVGLFSGLVNNFSPVPISGQSLKGVAASMVPTAMRPFADLAINENFFGSPIYNEPFDENQAQSSVSRFSTPEGYKAVVEFLNEATGGKGRVAGAVDLPAESLEYLMNYYVGGAGKFLGKLMDWGKKLGTGEEITARDVPLFNKVLGEPNNQNDLGLYYDRINEISPVERQLRNSFGQERRDLMEKFPVETDPRVIASMKQAKQQLKEANQVKRNLLDRDMDDAVRQERLDKLNERIHNIYLKFNDTYNQAKEREE